MQAERPSVLTCSPSFSTTCSESPAPRQWTPPPQPHHDVSNSGFDFSFDCRPDSVSSPISADQIFHNGKIKPTLLFQAQPNDHSNPKHPSQNDAALDDPKQKRGANSRRKALRRHFIDDRNQTDAVSSSSCSSTSSLWSLIADQDLESVPSDSYCVWKPKTTSSADEVEGRRVKRGEGSSSSFSRRWKLMDLWNSNSSTAGTEKKEVVGASGRKASVDALPPRVQVTGKEAEKKRLSYLPYRQGIFGNSNGSRNHQR